MSSQCQYIYIRGRNANKRCPCIPKDPGRNYCYVHYKYMMQKQIREEVYDQGAEADPILGRSISRNPKAKKARNQVKKMAPDSRFSTFLITINSQKNIDNMTNESKALFRKFGNYLFGPEMGIVNFLSDNYSPGGDPRPNLMSAKAHHFLEVGPHYGKVHLHATLQTEHNGHYRVNLGALRAFGKRIFGYNLHYSVGASYDPVKAMERYISKKSMSNVVNF